ncbi:MAG: hypothetical protein JO224_01100 [Pelomonas sp.]|nr:hypothetical protein [Roseateles sp.]
MRGFLTKAIVGGLLLAGLAGPAAAAQIRAGFLMGESQIFGRFDADDMKDLRKTFPQGLDRPLLLDVDPLHSAPDALLALGAWLRAQRAILDVYKACVGDCAWLLANSGRAIGVRRDAVIAFDTANRFALIDALRDKIEAGELFADASAASRERFMARYKPLLDMAAAFGARTRETWPAPMLAFVAALRGPLTEPRLAFTDTDFSATLQGSPGRCLWWVPDAEGLRQIGLEVPGYVPPPLDRLAKLLDAPAAQIYVGPLRDAVPDDGLCGKP